MAIFPFRQVDVFTSRAGKGNPLAVVHDAGTLTDEAMAAFAAWTNLSETVFLLPATTPGADYRLRIFTPVSELPFAGHPTLGACHAWLEAGGVPQGADIVQQCRVRLVRIRRDGRQLAFAAPELAQQPVPPALLADAAAALRIPVAQIRAARLLSPVAPRWIGLLLEDRATVLALQPDRTTMGDMDIGVIGPWPGGAADFEVRAFAPEIATEDPVTGSLNAGLARWLIGAGLAPARYVAAQGTCLGREGRVFIAQHDGVTWVGGQSVTCITGQLSL